VRRPAALSDFSSLTAAVEAVREPGVELPRIEQIIARRTHRVGQSEIAQRSEFLPHII
jgi:hypothetical protein